MIGVIDLVTPASLLPVLGGADDGRVAISGPLAESLCAPLRTDHLHRMSDDTGVLEHAEGALPRLEHGYCTDDISRALLVVSALPAPSAEDMRIADRSLAFLRAAALPSGRFRSRMSYARTWSDEGESDDASGRALMALGSAALRSPSRHVRRVSFDIIERQADFRSEYMRSTAFAAIGACDAIDAAKRDGTSSAACWELARHAAVVLPRLSRDTRWPWPERRLTYANAVLPEALLALSRAVDPSLLRPGLEMLEWLTERMMASDRLSPPGDGGWTVGESRPGFDQQPIETACLARAASAAWDLTGDVRWLRVLVLCAAWFLGVNDTGVALIDGETGGCCDGLLPQGRNENQGAESTLAWMETALLVHSEVRRGTVQVRSSGIANGS